MKIVSNKTFSEIVHGDTVSVERTLQASDVRAWVTAFGEWNMLATPGESQVAAGIASAMLTLDISNIRIVPTVDAEGSALQAAMPAGRGEIAALMKGSLHTAVLYANALMRDLTILHQKIAE